MVKRSKWSLVIIVFTSGWAGLENAAGLGPYLSFGRAQGRRVWAQHSNSQYRLQVWHSIVKHSWEVKLWWSRVTLGSLGKHDTVTRCAYCWHTCDPWFIWDSTTLNTLKHVNACRSYPYYDLHTNRKSEGQFLSNRFSVTWKWVLKREYLNTFMTVFFQVNHD